LDVSSGVQFDNLGFHNSIIGIGSNNDDLGKRLAQTSLTHQWAIILFPGVKIELRSAHRHNSTFGALAGPVTPVFSAMGQDWFLDICVHLFFFLRNRVKVERASFTSDFASQKSDSFAWPLRVGSKLVKANFLTATSSNRNPSNSVVAIFFGNAFG
jgi:hypothetical protein